MNGFGMLLRNYRHRGAAISDWECGVSKIHADHRPDLVGIVKILHQCGGIDSPTKANMLLQTGNYHDLDRDESASIFQTLREGYELQNEESNELSTNDVGNRAVAEGCNFIITHNQKDFKNIEEFGIQAMSPVEFLQMIGVVK